MAQNSPPFRIRTRQGLVSRHLGHVPHCLPSSFDILLERQHCLLVVFLFFPPRSTLLRAHSLHLLPCFRIHCYTHCTPLQTAQSDPRPAHCFLVRCDSPYRPAEALNIMDRSPNYQTPQGPNTASRAMEPPESPSPPAGGRHRPPPVVTRPVLLRSPRSHERLASSESSPEEPSPASTYGETDAGDSDVTTPCRPISAGKLVH